MKNVEPFQYRLHNLYVGALVSNTRGTGVKNYEYRESQRTILLSQAHSLITSSPEDFTKMVSCLTVHHRGIALFYEQSPIRWPQLLADIKIDTGIK